MQKPTLNCLLFKEIPFVLRDICEAPETPDCACVGGSDMQ
jgi:hypothetical protein